MNLTACSNNNAVSHQIVTSFYPLEFIAKTIVRDDFKVVNITPLGAEPHDLELDAKTIEKIDNAKLTIVLGGGFQPSIEKIAKQNDNSINIMKLLNDNSDDPHVWLDPLLMSKVVDKISNKLVTLNPEKKDIYTNRAKLLKKKLSNLDVIYSDTLQKCELDTFVTSHEAFSRLAKRYDLNQKSIAGFSPDSEPSAKKISELRDIVKDSNIDTIFTEELVSSKVAKTLSNDLNIKTEVLSPIEGLTKEQQDKKVNYFTLMNSNLKKLSTALRCGE